MKKFLLLFVFCFFLIPKDTFALEMSLKPNRIDFYNTSGNTLAYTNGFTAHNYSNLLFWGVTYNGSPSSNLYTFPSNGNIDITKHYDFNFFILQPNINQGTYSNSALNNNTPVVSVGHSMCDVNSTSTMLVNGISWSTIFSVRCPNVQLNQQAFTVNVMTPPANGDSLILQNFYAISSMFNITESFNYSAGDLNNAIKENTEQIKQQTEETKKQTEETKKQTDTIKDSDTTDASNSANSFFDDFSSDDFGLTAVITAPLNFIKSLSSTTCSSLDLQIPFLPGNNILSLPCMTSIYKQYFGSILTIYQAITFGLISYFILVDILRLVNNFKNPDNDEIEVIDL